MTISTRWITCGVLLGACIMLAGCERKPKTEESSSSDSAKPPAATLPADLFTPQAPAGAKSVAEVKADAGLKGAVVVHGRIGGRKDPFVEGAAMFLLADAAMKSCDQLHGDSCETPWDYCCEPHESLAAKIATVQVVGADGKPLRVGLKGKHGIEPLASVTIAGEITKRDDAGTLVINASKIHVTPKEG